MQNKRLDLRFELVGKKKCEALSKTRSSVGD